MQNVRSLLVVAAFLIGSSLHAASPPGFYSFDDFLKQHTSAIFSDEKDSLFSLFWRQALQQGILQDGHSSGRWRNELPYLLRWFITPTKPQ